ncbi:MAG: ankyrin repeat domain-containing protein [Phycisphaerales bacterium]|nr:ankyrin repeat domain-containing protein [Phycisphaerales bacterium]
MVGTQKKGVDVVVAFVLAFVLGGCDPTSAPSSDHFEAWVRENGGDVKDLNGAILKDGYALIHRAAQEGRVDMLGWLKDRGADVNAKTNSGWTPMHSAARGGRVEVMKWLKEQGADVSAKNDDGKTPMFPAANGGHVEAMRWLKEQGVDVNARSNDGLALMHFAAIHGRVEVMKWLKEQGVDINAKDHKGRTPLAVAGSDEAKEWLQANEAE